MSHSDSPKTGLAILVVLTAIIGFDIMAIMVRLLSARGYTAVELSAYRNFLGMAPSFMLMAWMGELSWNWRDYRITRWKLALMRGFLVTGAQLCYYTALSVLELATISALAQTSALFVVVLSVVLLREKVGPWRIAALAIGFAGVIWVLRPGTEAFSVHALLPILAAFGYSTSIITVRYFDKSVSNALLYIYSSIVAILGSVVLALLTTGFSPIASGLDMVLILAMSLAGGVAVLLLMIAYRMAMPSLLAPFFYLGILTAFGFGWIIFDEAPIDTLFPGALLIAGAGFLIVWRENRDAQGRA